jgi:uncharacterized membrane protein YukC
MEGQITLTLYQMIAIISAIVVPVVGALAYVYKRSESKSEEIVTLTKSFVEVTKDHTKVLEKNTEVIKTLPDTIMLLIKAASKS